MRRKKVSIIGSGHTGSTLAFITATRDVADVVLVDREKNKQAIKGKTLDILQSGSILGFDTHVTSTTDYSETKDSDVVVITAGVPRLPGMTRDELIQTNEQVMIEVTKQIVKYSPECKIIVLTNPVDAMTYTVYQKSGFPSERVMGQSGVLDSARFNTFVADALGVAVNDVHGIVLGGHGDTMVPLIRYSHVNGVPLNELLPQEKIQDIIKRTQNGGAEIVKLLGDGSAYYAPAAAVYEMVEAIILDKKRVLPSIAYCDGVYGLEDLYIGVPTVLGANGIEKIIEIDLTDEERQQFAHSAEAVRHLKTSLKAQA